MASSILASGSASLALLPQYIAPSAWWEHVPVAHWLIATLKPPSVVELGSHYGVSLFAFCEAAACYSPSTFVYAVDTWEGDGHAGAYGHKVFLQVSAHQQRHHLQRSRIIRSTFDAASASFADASIDLIHIDGLHTYDAVSHDYLTWHSKLRPGGSILFHDINVRERDFGVWRLWDEICADPAYRCLALLNGHGLGIATRASEQPAWHQALIELQPALAAKGALLAQLALLRPEGHFSSTDMRPYKEQLEALLAQFTQLQRDFDALTQQHALLHQHVHNLGLSLAAMQRSMSWRLTLPLRRLGLLARALRHPS